MTGLLHEKEFSRRSFVKGGGALIVGFSISGSLLAGKASGAVSPFASNAGDPADGVTPGTTPLNAVDSFIAILGDNTATLKSGRVEIGQGTSTGLLMIAAEELNLPLSQMHWVNVDTDVTPDTGGTYGSSSIKSAGPIVRAAAAYAQQALFGLAATQFGVPAVSLSAANGVISGGGKSATYAELLGGQFFNTTMTAATLTQFQAPAKPVSAYTLVTTSPPRIDIPAKVIGTYTYVHNIQIPGMLHARIVRPRGQGGYGTGAPITSIDASSVASVPGVQILRKGNFLGVVAPHEYNAIQAAAQLKVAWENDPILPGDGDVWEMERQQDAAGLTQNTITKTGNTSAALASAAKVLSASYTYEYNSHSPIGPTCCLADVTANGAVIYTNSADSYVERPRVAAAVGLPVDLVRFRYYEGGGSFGGAPNRYDAPVGAAVLSQLAGKPIRLQYMRWDETGWDAFGPNALQDVTAGIDAQGNIVAYENARWNLAGAGLAKLRETSEELLGATVTAAGVQATISTAFFEPVIYNIPNQTAVGKAVPYLNGGYLKQAPIREDATARYAVEVMIDELAYAAGMDPIAFRVQNMSPATNSRDINALLAVQQAANWVPRVAASKLDTGTIVRGRGVAATGATGAVVAEIEVNKKTGKITATHMFGAQDVGLAISPGLVENQMSGSLIQTTSRTLLEGVRYTKNRSTSLDFVSYPILRFEEAPGVTTVVVQRSDQVSTGAGEPLVPGTPPALANAFFDATGVRIRQYPLTPGRVLATLKAGGTGSIGTG